MAKVKVYELAKELNINSKDIINFLSEKKIEVKSHMSNLEEASIELIHGKFGKKETKTITKPETETRSKEEAKAKEEAPTGRPKKKASITAVFNPQNSQQGFKRPPKRGSVCARNVPPASSQLEKKHPNQPQIRA